MKKSLVEKILSLSFILFFDFFKKGGAWYEMQGDKTEFLYSSVLEEKEVKGEFVARMKERLDGVDEEVVSEGEYLGMEEAVNYVFRSSQIGDEWKFGTLIRLRGLLKEPLERNYNLLSLGANQKCGWKVTWSNRKGWHSCLFSSYGGNGYSNHGYTAIEAGVSLGEVNSQELSSGILFLQREGFEVNPPFTPERVAWIMLFSLLVEKRDNRRGDGWGDLERMEAEEDISSALRQFRESVIVN